MTLAERLEERGVQRGLHQGEHRNATETARRMLNKGFTFEQIAELTGLPLHEVELLDTE